MSMILPMKCKMRNIQLGTLDALKKTFSTLLSVTMSHSLYPIAALCSGDVEM
jgi:hypothetical protein